MLFRKILSRLKESDASVDEANRRTASRRTQDHCVAVIAGQTFPVENWSLGGLLLYGDARLFALNETIDCTVRFRLRDTVSNISHRARIIRKTHRGIALQFVPLTQQIREQFQAVVDDFIVSEFADSQTV